VQHALEALSIASERVDTLVCDEAANLGKLEIDHPVLGSISGYEPALVIAAHRLRHRNQIEEIKAALQAS
jgi:hypothetical protein